MRFDDLEKAKSLISYYLMDLYYANDGPCEFVSERHLKEAKEHKAFIKSLDFRQIKAELLKKIDCEIKEIREALDE